MRRVGVHFRSLSRKASAVLALVIALSTMAAFPQPIRADNQVPRYEETRCRFQLPDNYRIRCGNLIVLEDRTKPDGATIALHVAVVRAKSRNATDDPIVYLDGGPGGHTLETLDILLPEFFAKYAVKRDFILFDQRGVGLSEPALECSELEYSRIDLLRRAVTEDEANVERNKALQECHDRLVNDGINLAAYNSHENAADLNDLRTVLGYQEWNLYGISYGTRLALTAMRDFPEGIRSVVLDSTYPPNAALYEDIPSSAARSFQALFDGCAANKVCARAFPKLDSVFYTLVKDLNENPVSVSVSFSKRNFKVVVTGNRVLDTLFDLMYSTSAIPYLPGMIWDIKEGNYDDIAKRILENNIGTRSIVSTGMYYSVQCQEEVEFSTQAQLDAADAKYPEQNGTFSGSNIFKICQGWGLGRAPAIENKAVSSDIPTLILSGEYDPITPPTYAEMAAKSLSNAYMFEFPGIGHGVSVSGICPSSIMQQFLENPYRQPSSGCIRKMKGPDFVTH
ncbi:MAG: alpha/beta fold hydrolase [Anaerolineae bacterium]|nr:alpha/beta fold hydrolase [Anaerolineae bacterium]